VHETPDTGKFLSEVLALLNPGGKLLVAEPSFHIKADAFSVMIEKAEKIGFKVCDRPRIRFSRAVVFRKE
jgi:hypothetical protein